MSGERQRVQLIVQTRIHVMALAIAVVAQNVPEERERRRIELAATDDYGARCLVGVCVVQLEEVLRSLRGLSLSHGNIFGTAKPRKRQARARGEHGLYQAAA